MRRSDRLQWNKNIRGVASPSGKMPTPSLEVNLGQIPVKDVSDLRPNQILTSSLDSDRENREIEVLKKKLQQSCQENCAMRLTVENLQKQLEKGGKQQIAIDAMEGRKMIVSAETDKQLHAPEQNNSTRKPNEEEKSGGSTSTAINQSTSTAFQCTYASVVKSNRERSEGMKLDFIDPQDINGKQGVEYSQEDVEGEMMKWKNAVVVYVLGSRPPFHVMQGFLHHIWSRFGSFQLILLKSGVYIVQFESENAHIQILELGPWTFDNKPLIVKQWTPEVSLEKEGMSKIPVWIRLPNLPLQFWSVKMISQIVSAIGKPLFTDRMKATKERLLTVCENMC
ncbi:hypothetical protein RJ640_002893 [Escallonia rubra]|uniref:DUF4283 domain-containing protein n=1 Tax=Escallonia rubra TaxID=112253 RepID=A0AA88RD21_9ASTE|nr:hypothetical protein RJ640_002893 [Escallonia rubra]